MWGMPMGEIPEGDILIHAGDGTHRGRESEMIQFHHELIKHKRDSRYKKGFKEIIIVPGNHDWAWQRERPKYMAMYHDIQVLINDEFHYYDEESNKVIKFWGSPVTPPSGHWAFMESDRSRKELWEYIPEDTDVVITHGPPKYILDEVPKWNGEIENTGCPSLHNRMLEVKPKYHVFGHIHEGYGQFINKDGTTFVNPSIMDERYEPVNKPIVIEI